MPFDILLVDDHKILRCGIKAILGRDSDFCVVAEAENGTDALRFVRELRPQIVLMDIGLPGISGIEATAEILRFDPLCKVVMLSMYGDEKSVLGAVRSGACGFILKNSEVDLLEALHAVATGGAYLSPQVSGRLISRIQSGNLDTQVAPSAVDSLSPRELQVLRMVSQGMTSKEVAVSLGLSEQTVRSYRKTMMKKLGVNNVAGLTHVAMAAGLTQTGSMNHAAKAGGGHLN